MVLPSTSHMLRLQVRTTTVSSCLLVNLDCAHERQYVMFVFLSLAYFT
jgi:hypothetical protein